MFENEYTKNVVTETESLVADLKIENDIKNIHEVEKVGYSLSNFDFLPILFKGIKTNAFGYSSSKQKNPFFELYKVATNEELSFSDRTQAIRYMQRIPHIERSKYCIDAMIKLIVDERFPLSERYHFFSNSEKFIKLDYDIVHSTHYHFYFNYYNSKMPLIYKILSAQHLLGQCSHDFYDHIAVQNFLKEIAENVEIEIHHRAECADILDRLGFNEYKNIGNQILCDLSYEIGKNKNELFTIYANAQNVHDKTITKKLYETIKYLNSNVKVEIDTTEIYELFRIRIADKKYDNIREKAINSFQRLLIDTSRYEGLTLCEIMCLVFSKMKSLPENYEELIHRFIEEVADMDLTCSSGHVSRLLNVLSGFFEDVKPIQISYIEQLKANIFALYTQALQQQNEMIKSAIFDEIAEEKSLKEKPTVEEMINSYDFKTELFDEFKEYIENEEFEKEYEKAINSFFGLK
jgi:hypothetical protein